MGEVRGMKQGRKMYLATWLIGTAQKTPTEYQLGGWKGLYSNRVRLLQLKHKRKGE